MAAWFRCKNGLPEMDVVVEVYRTTAKKYFIFAAKRKLIYGNWFWYPVPPCGNYYKPEEITHWKTQTPKPGEN